jgi:outer membrane lipoprotein carrier protein
MAEDKKAALILDQLSEKTKSHNTIQIEFEHIFSNKSAGINEKSSGILELQGDNFRIDMAQQLIINNGTTHWIYLKEMNEVQIIDYDTEEEDALSPNKLFTVYNEDYKNAYVEEKTIGVEKMHIIDLFPKESGPIMKVRLTINALKNEIHILALYDKNGGVYTYNIKSFKSDISLPSFTFNTANYPDVEVIDLR